MDNCVILPVVIVAVSIIGCSCAPLSDFPTGAAVGVSQFVDLHIGTGGTGFGVGGSPPGAQLPFGCIRASPDTSDAFGDAPEFTHFGGYHYGDDTILCFSHTHMVGPGVQDYGNIGMMPISGKMNQLVAFDRGYRSKYSHASEIATPGVYSVVLDNHNIHVEVAACGGPQAVSYRMTWPNSEEKHQGSAADVRTIVFDLGHSLPRFSVDQSSVWIGDECWHQGQPAYGTPKGAPTHRGQTDTPARVAAGAAMNVTICGWANQRGSLTERNGHGVGVYFAANLSLPVGATVGGFGTWMHDHKIQDKQWLPNVAYVNGTNVGAYIEITGGDKAGDAVDMTLALSFVSVSQAMRNLEEQMGTVGASHTRCVAEAKHTWEQTLGRIQVQAPPSALSHGSTSSPQDEMIKFYTAFYHAQMAPTTFTESGNVYRGMDGKVHQFNAPDHTVYMSDMSIWDIFRCQVPLFSLLTPSKTLSIVKSLLQMHTDGGDVPRWPIASVYSGCMIGQHAIQIFLDAVAKGIISDADEIGNIFSIAKTGATSDRPHAGRSGWQDYEQYGFLPADKHSSAASQTLAYSFDDWALAELAAHAGLPADHAVFLNRSLAAYRNIWDSKSQYFCPRNANGTFACDENPIWHGWMFQNDGFTEGDAAEWRWFVPHDLPGLVQLFPTKEDYVRELDNFFNKTYSDLSTTLPNPYYWAGNEPGILEPFQFNVAGRPDLTQRHSRTVMRLSYTTEPNGMPGNDDFGALSSWYVWAALGLYPLTGTTTYILGSPVFPDANITLESGHVLRILAHDASPECIYVAKAAINGAVIPYPENAYVDHKDISSGGTLEFWMTSTA
eukprot:m.885435 g.885435  ORF g.885435 m.885435 type:complete len:835 (+) comp23619_c0_seq5:360-2864(+)